MERYSDKDLERKERELSEREKALYQREVEVSNKEEKANKRLRDNLYDRITVTPETMNIIIVILSVLIVIFIIVGVLY